MANGHWQKWWEFFFGLGKNAMKSPWEKLRSATGVNMDVQQTGKLRKVGSIFLSFNYPFHTATNRGI